MATEPDSIQSLVQRFRAHIKDYKSKDTKEAEIRLKFIDPFWRALGWDVGDTAGLGPTLCDVVVEKNVETVDDGGLTSRRPDYLFRAGGAARFVVEAKKPIIDIDQDNEAIFQAKRYAWSSNIAFAILTDFEQFRVYDTTLKPIINDPNRGLVKEFKLDYDSYETQWDVLTATFGRAAVADNSLERLLANVKKIRPGKRVRAVDRMLIDLKGVEPVDEAFLSVLDIHRRHLAQAIYKANKAKFPEADTLHGSAKLTEAVQRIMDRLVFMRVCEDRGVVPFGGLRDTLERIGTEGGEFYEALVAECRAWDRKYNGYLFKPWPLEDIKVDGAVLADFIRDLYPPEGPWNFAAIADDILGIVYERFLGNTIEVKGGRVAVELKPEYRELAKKTRHKTGVFYTPRFVVDSIVRRVLGPKLAGRTPAEVLDVKILDPACGSGTFLVAALQYLFDYCLQKVHDNPEVARAVVPALSAGSGSKGRKKKSEIAFQDAEKNWYLAPDFRAALMTHCIHGVDIDQQAVEVTVMSLYLKMLESRLPKNWQLEWVEHRLLPSLDNNIRCGNSLISPADYMRFQDKMDKKQGGLFREEDADTEFRINRFNWESETGGFGRLLKTHSNKARGGERTVAFDCIIGNPPYIRVQELNKWAPQECTFYKWRYASAAKGNYDIYVVFTERALALLVPGGLLGFIMPHKFWQAEYGASLRRIIAEGKNLKGLVDFGDQQVFTGATTYTAIHVLSQGGKGSAVDYAKVLELDDGLTQCAAIDAERESPKVLRVRAAHPTGNEPWSFKSDSVARWCHAVGADSILLADLAEVFVGVQTSADDIYHLDVVSIGGESITVKSRADERTRVLEMRVLRPLVSGQDTRAFAFELARQVILFPYQWTGSGETLLHPTEYLEANAPAAWEYLRSHEAVLRAREGGRFDDDKWFQFGRSQNIGRQKGPKLCVPRLSDRLRCAFDAAGTMCLDNVDVNGVRLFVDGPLERSQENHLFLCGILNSLLAESYIRATVSTHFRGGFASYNRQFLGLLPIKVPVSPAAKRLAGRISDCVSAIMEAKDSLRKPHRSDRETQQLKAAVEAHEARINEAVFELYGVDGLPS